MSLSLQEISLDRKSDVPLQQQLAQQLRMLVLAGRFAPKTKLPSSRALALELQVARATVVAAFNQLTDEGYFEVRAGSATRVAAILPETLLTSSPISKAQRVSTDAGRPAISRKPPRPFRHGVVEWSYFPHDVWGKLLGNMWRNPTMSLMSYDDVLGWLPLRQAIAQHLREWRAIDCDPAQIIITAGAMDAFALLGRVVFSAGDRLWVEEPGYPTAWQIFSQSKLELTPVPVDEEGLQVSVGVKKCPTARGVIVTPARQYPTGVIMSVARRLALLGFARQAGAYIIEDDYDSEYRYIGQPLPALYDLDKEGRTIYLGSFSKVFSPLLRLGYLVVPAALINRFQQDRISYGAPPSLIAQPALAEFMAQGFFGSHIRRMRRIYASRHQTLITALEPGRGRYFSIAHSTAGLLLLLRLKSDFNEAELIKQLTAEGIEVEGLSAHYHGRRKQPGLLLSFAGFSEKELQQAADKLLTCLARYKPHSPTA